MMTRFIKILIIVTGCLCIKTGQAQIINSEAKFKAGAPALNFFLSSKFTAVAKNKNLNLCLISVTFAKFTIDTIGNIKTLSFLENDQTPSIFRELLKITVESTNGQWSPAIYNNKVSESKPFILPLIYQMEAGCTINGKKVYNGTDNALVKLFKEAIDTKSFQIDCTLLNPIIVFSQN